METYSLLLFLMFFSLNNYYLPHTSYLNLYISDALLLEIKSQILLLFRILLLLLLINLINHIYILLLSNLCLKIYFLLLSQILVEILFYQKNISSPFLTFPSSRYNYSYLLLHCTKSSYLLCFHCSFLTLLLLLSSLNSCKVYSNLHLFLNTHRSLFYLHLSISTIQLSLLTTSLNYFLSTTTHLLVSFAPYFYI